MIIYEIRAMVEPELKRAFELYMERRHIPDMIKTTYFKSGKMSVTEEGIFVVEYSCESMDILEEYLDEAADALRSDFQKNFPQGVSIERKIYPDTRG